MYTPKIVIERLHYFYKTIPDAGTLCLHRYTLLMSCSGANMTAYARDDTAKSRHVHNRDFLQYRVSRYGKH